LIPSIGHILRSNQSWILATYANVDLHRDLYAYIEQG
jgi:hypothetical protein